MSQHILSGRDASEVLWPTRRRTLQAAAAWVALGGWQTASAQWRSNVVEWEGEALINNEPLTAQTVIQSGDVIATGPKARLLFVIGDAAFHVRQNSLLTVERGERINTINLVRLLAGGVSSVWQDGGLRRLVTPIVHVDTRGSGLYAEVHPDDAHRTYCCNCYGALDLVTTSERRLSKSEYHDAYSVVRRDPTSVAINHAQAANHTDEEMEFLARLLQTRTAWQVSGRKGTAFDT